ncbi:PIG-L family deacetylase [Chelativorans sp.]|uniref:PIG-L deacetylase family protein n=1 Tax=Chelativorans sp. TaxID=2203393 RepID=UPI00281157FC|nr:PIG-L family deacetylase [Chelativorans sp.]
MTAMLSLAELELLSPAESLLELICSPEGGVLDCRDVLVVVAHPDDETIAIGGQLTRMQGVRLLHVTDGAPVNMADAEAQGFSRREDYAAARRRELEAAVAVAGLGPEALLSFDVPDQSTAFRLSELSRRLADLLQETEVGTVITHAYEGGHPDHDATAFIARAACHLLGQRNLPAPAVYEFPLYHMRHGEWVFQEFAPGHELEFAIALDEEAAEMKRRMLAAHVTQQRTLGTFRLKAERFRPAMPCDFHQLPNEGEVLYGQFDWGLRPSDWPALVDKACRELGLPKWL